MFVEGTILFFDPFYFKNGNASKAKYFIVLKIIEDKIILASLPSSQDFVPNYVDKTTAECIEIPEANFNCYLFAAGKVIASNGWAFPKNTFVYGQQIDVYETETLEEIYPIEGVDYEIKGEITKAVFDAMMLCFKNSASVKRKFKKLL